MDELHETLEVAVPEPRSAAKTLETLQSQFQYDANALESLTAARGTYRRG